MLAFHMPFLTLSMRLTLIHRYPPWNNQNTQAHTNGPQPTSVLRPWVSVLNLMQGLRIKSRLLTPNLREVS